MFKLTTYSRFKSTVYRVVSVFTSTTVSIFEITVLRIALVFSVFCMDLHLFGELSVSCVQVMDMKLCEPQCTVTLLMLLYGKVMKGFTVLCVWAVLGCQSHNMTRDQ